MEPKNSFYLDQDDCGLWLIKQGDQKWFAGPVKYVAEIALELVNTTHRPNLEMSDNDLMICWNLHDKGDDCEYEVLIKNVLNRATPEESAINLVEHIIANPSSTYEGVQSYADQIMAIAHQYHLEKINRNHEYNTGK